MRAAAESSSEPGTHTYRTVRGAEGNDGELATPCSRLNGCRGLGVLRCVERFAD